jgi:uncharacterized phiE125 gp8 family phage protein
MGWKLKTGPTIEPVTLPEAKLHLKIDSDTTDDNLVTALITAAREQAEKYTGRALIEQSWEYKFEEFEDDEIELPNPPAISVTSITYVDTSGVTQTLSTSVYDLDAHTDPGRVFLKYNQLWPSTLDIENAVTITYKCGYGTAASSVPASIRAAILLIIGHLYQNRENVVVGRTPVELPQGAESLLNAYRIYNL